MNTIARSRMTHGATALVALALLFIGITILISFVLRGARSLGLPQREAGFGHGAVDRVQDAREL